ncbi:hypothetical protein BN1051_01617 [Arthrobacter saudimassiliensis]|uniref:Uncharacterized protein n=1 Tax=Arthrobacter saudimassiliensis TaxID=1461584 RepID=A0A078MS94_9MICC|nr:hypothetical protein BN1051_01617 [Arthrobacter saudimassiliensis]
MATNRYLRRALDALPSLVGLAVLAWLLLDGAAGQTGGLTGAFMTGLAAAVAVGVLVRVFGPARGRRPIRDALAPLAGAAAAYNELLTSQRPGSPPEAVPSADPATPSGLPDDSRPGPGLP